MEKNSRAEQKAPEFELKRSFDAPRELLWQAWTNPEKVQQWWGPNDFTAPICLMDLRVGGKYLVCMRNIEGHDFWSTGMYREIDRPGKLVMTDSFSDARGNIVPASHYGITGQWPLEMLITLKFELAGKATRIILRHQGIPEMNSKETQKSWNESFDKLSLILNE